MNKLKECKKHRSNMMIIRAKKVRMNYYVDGKILSKMAIMITMMMMTMMVVMKQ